MRAAGHDRSPNGHVRSSPSLSPVKVGPAPVDADVQEWLENAPQGLYLGTSSWTFPGWNGLVYDRPSTREELTYDGLAAYAKSPLFRTVCIDRGFYAPISIEDFQRYAASVQTIFVLSSKPTARSPNEHSKTVNIGLRTNSSWTTTTPTRKLSVLMSRASIEKRACSYSSSHHWGQNTSVNLNSLLIDCSDSYRICPKDHVMPLKSATPF